VKNRYGNKDSRLAKNANDGVAFATINEDKKKGNKKKDVTCYKCNKIGHPTNVMKSKPLDIKQEGN